MSCGCMHGFGLDQAGIDSMTTLDASGVRYWKTEVITIINNALQFHCVREEEETVSPTGTTSAHSAKIVSVDSGECTSSLGPADTWVQKKLSSGMSVMASFGLAIPDASLQKYLFACPDDLSLLKQMSQNSPVIALSPAMFANLNLLAQQSEAEQQVSQAGLGVKNWPLTIGLMLGASVLFFYAFRGQKRR